MFRKFLLKLTPFFNLFFNGKFVQGFNLTFIEPKNITIGNGVIFEKNCFLNAYQGKIVIGEKSAMNYSTFISAGFGEIFISKNVLIGPQVSIRSSNHSLDRTKRHVHNPGKIIIEENVWIGANATILPNVVIGKNSIIGAGSVVTKSIPSNCIAIGNPCKVIKKQ